MTKDNLKTLKDIYFNLRDNIEDTYIRFRIKEEAIKWVNWMKKDNNKTAMKKEGFFKEFLVKDELAFLFIKFFNITEEDLK